MTQRNLRKKGTFWLPFYSPSWCVCVLGGNQSWNSRQELGEIKGDSTCWLVPGLTFSYLSYAVQDSLPRGGRAHNRLGPPASVNSQENAPQTCLQARLIEEIPQVGFAPCLPFHQKNKLEQNPGFLVCMTVESKTKLRAGSRKDR